MIDFEKAWNENKEDFLRLIRIPSVYDEKTIKETAPYGEGCRMAYDFMKSLCMNEGFAIKEFDGKAFCASYGKGERIDIASHLDVVSVSDDWDIDPFSGVIKDGFVYGRGTQDMKSGAFLTFLALKLIKNQGIFAEKEIRLVYGLDEERTMDDMRHYIKEAGYPSFAFSPDGAFPVTVGEKGALMWTLEGLVPSDNGSEAVLEISAGIQPNVIVPYATALVCCEEALANKVIADNNIDGVVEKEGNYLRLITKGKSAHASRPEDGHNALFDLLFVLSEITKSPFYQGLSKVFGDPYGMGAGLDCDILPMGRLTMNPGVFSVKNGKISAMIDCRYPKGVTSDFLTEKLFEKISLLNGRNMKLLLPYDDKPTLVEDDDPYIVSLKKAYKESTGLDCKSLISGGVSYCKVFGRCVTFGTVLEGEKQLFHQRNERISEKNCIKALEIYYNSILEILKE